MTGKTYTMKQIQNCYYGKPASNARLTFDELKESLQRPEWEPADGEVYMYKMNDLWKSVVCGQDTDYPCPIRPQSLTNHGPAVRALRDFVIGVKERSIGTLKDDAGIALKAFNEVVKDD